jgi:thiamine phosphate synthase YjbQ (UPF0047 family)
MSRDSATKGTFQRIVFVQRDDARERTVRLRVLGTEDAS